jgi:hypothetical protein
VGIGNQGAPNDSTPPHLNRSAEYDERALLTTGQIRRAFQGQMRLGQDALHAMPASSVWRSILDRPPTLSSSRVGLLNLATRE